ncbi:MAG: XRE family transcriptional regulator [Syntrophobacteraceae bacterium CG2_30_61_12]|nr:MAG: XRE family transcriptional regulator [Syntrophobacteraceae bacterium CG2_30_61_12]PIU31244.1 MAG: XRE family transcriptional regulator [Syntrophobacteraceae bacterium CG07_land_8_20_14_0_80_61_8]
MKTRSAGMVCHLKSVRQSRGLSQIQLADLVGVKRQAIYDMESGKYMPNTVLALRLARRLACTVEDLFCEQAAVVDQPLTLVEDEQAWARSRVAVARIRERLVGYPLVGRSSLNDGLRPADGLFSKATGTVQLFCSEANLDNTILLLGCDPAFSVLSSHVSRAAPEIRIRCRFASSERALRGLAAGHAHLAGTHLHNKESGEANVALARSLLGGAKATLIGFSLMEEGLMVAPGNPCAIRTVADLAGHKVRLVNRETGAALRNLLDDYLDRFGIPENAVAGYDQEVKSHIEGAQMVAYHFADAALGLRAIAAAYGLDFVPVAAVRCDLVIPADLLSQRAVSILLDTLQDRRLRDELITLPGYEASRTGAVIAEL